ncbi:hypothetical protein ACFL1H_01140 [Nanoarchaeota archaeon]
MGEELIAKVVALETMSLEECTLEYKNTAKADFDSVLVEVIPEIYNRLIKEDDKLQFSNVGHICLMLNYIKRERKISPVYTIIDNYQVTIKNVKDTMQENDHNTLYQICMKDNSELVEQYLKKEGFLIEN